MNLKILSYNIHKGYDWNKKNYFLEDMKKLIIDSNADLVFLQEVVGQNTNYKKLGLIDKQFEFLADSIWPHYSYAQNSLSDHAQHGNLILSRYPIESWENINITTNSLEKRGLLLCRIQLSEIENKYIYAACVHLDLLHRGRKIQYETIKKKLQSLAIDDDHPLIVAGDFNDWNKAASTVFENELAMFEVHKSIHGQYAKTFPAIYPILSLDRIYVRNLKTLAAKIMVPQAKTQNKSHFSDHLALYCEVETGTNSNGT